MLGEGTLLYDNVVELQLHLSPLNNPFLHRVLCYQPKHPHLGVMWVSMCVSNICLKYNEYLKR